MMKADLHLHSTCSDGVLTPQLLAEEAQRAGVTIMAVTDHDTFEGSDQLRSAGSPIPVIPGVELSLNDLPGLHLLAYGYTDAPTFRRAVAQLSDQRVIRARQMLQRLQQLGMPLDWQLLQQKYHGTVGRPHIARAMVHAGYVKSMQEAFDRFLGHQKPAYVPAQRLSMAEALPLILGDGFLPVLAHPYELKLEEHLLEPLIDKWTDMGLRGMEVYHPSAAAHGYTALERMARRHGLLVTGGSDFHQQNDRHGQIGSICAAWTTAGDDMQALLQALTQQNT